MPTAENFSSFRKELNFHACNRAPVTGCSCSSTPHAVVSRILVFAIDQLHRADAKLPASNSVGFNGINLVCKRVLVFRDRCIWCGRLIALETRILWVNGGLTRMPLSAVMVAGIFTGVCNFGVDVRDPQQAGEE